MGSKNISISDEAYSKLKKFKGNNESFTDVINRLIGRAALLDIRGTFSDNDADSIIKNINESKDLSGTRSDTISDTSKNTIGSAVYLFQYANTLDFLGKEAEAIPLYLKAIKLGLSGKMKTQAEIQLGSSLSVTGEHEKAIAILNRVQKETVDPAALAFLCIALFRSGEIKKALKTALIFIISGNQGLLPEYQRALLHYIDEMS